MQYICTKITYNEERKKFNLNPLKYSPELSIIANKHSKDMAEQKKLTKNSLQFWRN